MTSFHTAKFSLGQFVRHTQAAFRGVVIDVDPVYSGPQGPRGPSDRGQPFYRVLAVGEDAGFLVYAPEDMLAHDEDVAPLAPEERAKWFTLDAHGHHAPRLNAIH